ncbi:MAG: hypothetical protein FGM57_01335 [Candidatus Taylorbacteria bacterium]|nr:hypothetical protein [Candidatus Taylorbacteria bacterium]
MKQAQATIRKIDKISEPLFWILAISLVCSSAVYVYFIQKAVRNVVLGDTYREQIASINSKLSDVEFQYINAVEGVTMDTARDLGFKSATDKTIFVTREHTGKNVAIR